MIIILSPSKTLGNIAANFRVNSSQPEFIDQSEVIVKRMRDLSTTDLKGLMKISQSLASLNHERFIKWHKPFNQSNSHPALLTFKGDVYEGLSVTDFTKKDFEFAQNHLRILSGLYGVLRPLDLMQPYRLEMGTKIDIGDYENLYKLWQNRLTEYFNNELLKSKEKVLVNLASIEYSKAINLKKLNGKVVIPIFKEQKGEEFKTIAIYAKRARGLMSRFAIKQAITNVEQLKSFGEEGYIFSSDLSEGNRMVFIR
ncbi:MAG TPA: peroxide stress protein YaaA [Bacteroidales bacterium]|nr:peroxide stress protein YaaA [Bacteroidales bacterium]